MAEVGLLPFARIALQVSKAVLPRYRSRFSKHQFTQPQLLAILCLTIGLSFQSDPVRGAPPRTRSRKPTYCEKKLMPTRQ